MTLYTTMHEVDDFKLLSSSELTHSDSFDAFIDTTPSHSILIADIAEFQVHISFGDEGDFLNNKDIYIDYPPDLTLITKPNIKPGWYEIYKPDFIHLRS